MEELIKKIQENGYWKIIIRPLDFQEKRISTKEECERLVKENQISLRGWNYPHIDGRTGIVRSGSDSVSSFCDWPEGGMFEFWKLYQNGQFVHYFAMPEDYRMDEEQKEKARKSFPFGPKDQKIDRFLSIINALYSLTEMHLFAARLAKATHFENDVEIIVELGNVENRCLFFWGEFFRHLWDAYICRYQPIEIKKTISAQELISNPTGLALDLAIEIFKEFNWKDADQAKGVFTEDQKKLTERRL